MKFHTAMPRSLQPFFALELREAKRHFEQGAFPECWRHYERAHIIGQPYPWQHSLVHWKMLGFGFAVKSPKEIAGQLPRLLLGGVKSFVGHIPVGNTGGVDVPPLRSMEIPDELKAIIAENTKHHG